MLLAALELGLNACRTPSIATLDCILDRGSTEEDANMTAVRVAVCVGMAAVSTGEQARITAKVIVNHRKGRLG